MEIRIIEKLNEILGLLKGKAVPDGWMDIGQVRRTGENPTAEV